MSDDDIFQTDLHKSRGPQQWRVNSSTPNNEDTNKEAEVDNVPAKSEWKPNYKVDKEMTGEGFKNVLAKVDRRIVSKIGKEKYHDLLLHAPCRSVKG